LQSNDIPYIWVEVVFSKQELFDEFSKLLLASTLLYVKKSNMNRREKNRELINGICTMVLLFVMVGLTIYALIKQIV
jgi:hypothetical protein